MAPASSKKSKEKKSAAPKARRGARGLFGGPSFLGNLITTILIFLFLMSAYSIVESLIKPSTTIPISTVASDVIGGKVKSITVSGDSLDITYTDDVVKTSQKDP
ncbi:MAG: hypothetical protein WCW36_01870, partial [Candidatus Paceibacterota bacterium]